VPVNQTAKKPATRNILKEVACPPTATGAQASSGKPTDSAAVSPPPATAASKSEYSTGSSAKSQANPDLKRSVARRKGGDMEDIASAVPPTKHASWSVVGRFFRHTSH
jgi:hypothetical protein